MHPSKKMNLGIWLGVGFLILGMVSPVNAKGRKPVELPVSNSQAYQTLIKGSMSDIKALFEVTKYPINPPDREEGPLHWAAYRGDPEVAAYLLNHGATVDAQALNLETPLIIAAEDGHVEVVKLLIAHGADVNRGGGYWPQASHLNSITPRSFGPLAKGILKL